jgi:hypothetical protein
MQLNTLAQQYAQAFTRGEMASFGGQTLHFSVVRAGTLYLPSGQIVACDPLVGREREPFVQAVLPGRYPVDLSLGRDVATNVERTAFARILFTKNEPVIWIKALRGNEAHVVTDDATPFGFAVNSGTAAFMDKETADRFQVESLDEVDHFLDLLVANYRPERNWLNHLVDDQHNVILFSARQGEGLIPSFFAIDDAGDVCLALTRLGQSWRD